MPWCLFRWVFCIEFDLKNGNVVRKKVFRKVLICPLWCQGRKLLGNGGNGAGAEEDDQTPPFDRFVPVIPGNPKQQDASRVSERFGGMRPDEASELLSFTCCFPLSLASLLAWMRFLLAHVGSSTHLPLVQGMVSHQFASSPGAPQAQTHPSIASVQLLFLRSTLLNWGSQRPPKGSELRMQSAAILQCYEGSHEKKSFPFSLDLKITQDV